MGLLLAVATRPSPDSIWDYLELRRLVRLLILLYLSCATPSYSFAP